MAKRKRPIVLRCPGTAEERQLIKREMAQIPTGQIGAYLRKMAIGGYILYTDTANIEQFNAGLRDIGKNINQIARPFNSGAPAYEKSRFGHESSEETFLTQIVDDIFIPLVKA